MAALHPLGATASSTWQHHYDLRLKLRYERLSDRYLFSYKYSIETTNIGGGLVETVASADWSPPMGKRALQDDIFLNIKISGDTWVEVATSGPDLFWSTTPGKEAIMTKDNRANLYSELEYWNDANND